MININNDKAIVKARISKALYKTFKLTLKLKGITIQGFIIDKIKDFLVENIDLLKNELTK